MCLCKLEVAELHRNNVCMFHVVCTYHNLNIQCPVQAAILIFRQSRQAMIVAWPVAWPVIMLVMKYVTL